MIFLYNGGLVFILIIILFILIIINYHKIEKNKRNYFNMDNEITKNVVVWLFIIVIMSFHFYKEGQIDVFKDNINFEQKIIKKYDNRTGDLIKQDTIYKYIGNKKE